MINDSRVSSTSHAGVVRHAAEQQSFGRLAENRYVQRSGAKGLDLVVREQSSCHGDDLIDVAGSQPQWFRLRGFSILVHTHSIDTR
jgi:hypothetical protein